MFRKSFVLVFILIVALTACRNNKKSEQEKPVARVYDLFLYPSDLASRIPEGVSNDDSIRISRRLTEEWVREKLLLNRAEQYLSADQKNVDKQIEEYRSSLLTFIYKQKLLSQNLDTVVNEQELQAYYDQNSSNYILDNDVVKVNYVKVPGNAPDLANVRRWYKSELPEDLDNLEKYCIIYASNYMIHGEQWFHFANLIDATPLKVSNVAAYLNSNKNIETNDSSFYYFIHIIDRVQEGQVAPLDLVKDDIRSVIINKRKIKFMEDLENSVYQDGRAKNKVEIY
jgi:hypothetical protein